MENDNNATLEFNDSGGKRANRLPDGAARSDERMAETDERMKRIDRVFASIRHMSPTAGWR